MKILHLSDLHIHGNRSDNKEVDDLFKSIQRNGKLKNHKLVITGDITDDGSIEQFKEADRIFEPFAGRIYFCPGNHDYGAAGNLYSKERAIRFDQMLTLKYNQGGTFTGDSTPVVNMFHESKVAFIALDSNLETTSPFDFACGEIGEFQLLALANDLSTIPSDYVKVLFFHHHPFMVNDPFMELKDANSLARIVYSKVDLILFGHKHVRGKWEKRWGTQLILASDNSSDKNYVSEISIENKVVSAVDLKIR